MIPETCVTLFHIHNVLLQAAYASQQDFEVWTELMQAGLGLYLLKAPRNIVMFTNSQLDAVLDALAHQDLWRFQRLLWQRLLPSIPTWESLQDFCSVIQGCEVQAQAAATAAAAALLPTLAHPSPPAHPVTVEAPSLWARTSVTSSCSGPWAGAGSPWPGAGGDSPSGSLQASMQHDSLLQQEPAHPALARPDLRTAPATAAAASVLYDKHAELGEYTSLMSECIRAAFEAAAVRGLMHTTAPHAAAQQLLEVATAFESRQRSPMATVALRYSFMPTSDWLSRVAAAGVQAGERLSAAQVIKLLQDLDNLAPKPFDCQSAPGRWLNAAGQAAVESAILRHTASRAWAPQQALSVVKVLAGKCRAPPGDQFCGMIEGLLLACNDARQDTSLLCTLLQEAVDFSAPGDDSGGSPSATGIPSAQLSLVRVALNRAIYLIESSESTEERCLAASQASTTGRRDDVGHIWGCRDFLFDRYPRLLQAARRFGYPLQALRLNAYAQELYIYLATVPGHELVAVGPEGLTRVLTAVASTPCCEDPQWAAAFERACLTLVGVQFSVGYTHPKRWMGLLDATVSALPFPMPAMAAAIKGLVVRLCDTRRHADYFWNLLPLVGALERRAAEAAPRSHHVPQHHEQDAAATGNPRASGSLARSPCHGVVGARKSSNPSPKTSRSAHVSSWRGMTGSATTKSGRLSGAANGSPGPGASSPVSTGLVVSIVPPPDLSAHLVSDDEYNRWCEDLGQRLALTMMSWSDQDRVAQLSVLGITNS